MGKPGEFMGNIPVKSALPNKNLVLRLSKRLEVSK